MKIYLLASLLLFSFITFSQKKVDWTSSYSSENSEIVLHAEIQEGWHLYSQYLGNDLGPISTEIVFNPNKKVQFSNKTNEPTPKVSYDENFGGDLSYFEKEVSFRNKIKVTGETIVNGYVVYMVCNDEMCLPPAEEKFEIKL
ncbi:MAG: protein-disulfide reductase DsbD N-terminal domain-containing protein [Lishizhenia sp.]